MKILGYLVAAIIFSIAAFYFNAPALLLFSTCALGEFLLEVFA